MGEKQEQLLRAYCARVLVKYGFEFSPRDPVIPVLYTIYQELNANKVGNDKVAEEIRKALEKLNPTIYNFNQKGEAWKFKSAEALPWLFGSLGIVIAVFAGLIWWRQYNDVGRAATIIQTSKGVDEIFLRSAKKDDRGYVYLEFCKAKGNVMEFWTEYNEVKKDTIRVYVGKVK
jgi:hypothetical protein